MPPHRTNREILTRGDQVYARKKLKTHGVDQVSFDTKARSEYLTGFHKRKVERQEKAREHAKEMERLEKIEERRKMREERNQAMTKDMERFNKAMKDLNRDRFDSSDSEEEEEEEKVEAEGEHSDAEGDEWAGFDDSKPNGILKKHYKDDDGDVTTVVIEEFDPHNTELDEFVDLPSSEDVLKGSIQRAEKYANVVAQVEKKPKRAPKKKVQKPRYLTKVERKANTRRERERHKDKKGRR